MTLINNIDNSTLDALQFQRITARPVAQWDFSALKYLSDGAEIYSAPDAAGNADLFSRTAGQRPVKATDADTGLAVARFSGAQGMTAEALGVREPSLKSVSSPATLVFVVKPVDYASQTSQIVGLMQGLNTSAINFAIINYTGTNTGQLYGGGNSILFGNSGNLLMQSILDGKKHIIVVTGDSAGATAYVDGYYVGTVSGDVFGVPIVAPRIGMNVSSNANYFTGDMCEIAIYQEKLSQRAVLALTRSLNTKWKAGLTLYDWTTTGANLYEDFTTSDGTSCRAFIPPQPNLDDPTLVLWLHPQSHDISISPSYFAYSYFRTAQGLGWYSAASNLGYSGSPGGSASSWGNPTAQNALLLLYQAMTAKIGKTPKVILLGASMGGFASALAIIKQTLPQGVVKGVYMIDAALSMWEFYQTSGYYGSINSGYSITTGTLSASAAAGATSISSSVSFAAGTVLAVGGGAAGAELVTVSSAGPSGSGPYTIPLTTALVSARASGVNVSDYGSKTAGSDPMLQSVTNFNGIPVRYTASTTDTTAILATNTTAFATRLAGISIDNTVVLHQAGHLGGGATNARDFVEFVKYRVAKS